MAGGVCKGCRLSYKRAALPSTTLLLDLWESPRQSGGPDTGLSSPAQGIYSQTIRPFNPRGGFCSHQATDFGLPLWAGLGCLVALPPPVLPSSPLPSSLLQSYCNKRTIVLVDLGQGNIA